MRRMGIKDEVMDAWADVLSPLFDDFAGDVGIEMLDKSTAKDELYDETVEGKKYLPPITIKCRLKSDKERLTLPGGELIDIDGKATFKTEDLRANGIEMDFSTRITFKGKSYSVIHIEETSNVGDEALLTKVLLKGA